MTNASESTNSDEKSFLASIHEAGRPCVVVQGLGFVGSAIATVIAAVKDDSGKPRYSVIGIDLPSESRRIDSLNKGIVPIRCDDPEFERLLSEVTEKQRNFRAMADPKAYELADVVLVDVNLDFDKTTGEAAIEKFQSALKEVASRIRPTALIIIESTVPPGTCSKLALPIFAEQFRQRGIATPPRLAHAYERVMPGRNYIRSIRHYWRCVSSDQPDTQKAAEAFLSTVIDTASFPLQRLSSTAAGELAKVLENSYRAANIAFIFEWTLLAEKMGVNLFEVVRVIRARKGTHDNMMLPGFGVGGYCLTKDGYLAQWAADRLFHSGIRLETTLRALEINEKMPFHTFDLLKEGAGDLRGKQVLVCGLSYLADVGDVRNSPTQVLVKAILGDGGIPIVHDPILEEPMGAVPPESFTRTLDARAPYDAIVFVVQHHEYKALPADRIAGLLRPGAAVIDAFDVLDDDRIASLLGKGLRVLGVGKGHIGSFGRRGQ